MFNFWRQTKRIYLDYAAATPMRAEVFSAMTPYFKNHFGNASAIHYEGSLAKQAVEKARQETATALGLRSEEIIFTGSGTESNNLVILGLIKKLSRVDGVAYSDMEIITTKIEHPSIMNLLPVLEATGVKINYVAVDSVGLIDMKSFSGLLSPKTVLVTFAYANSEIGVVQPVGKIAREVRRYAKENNTKTYIHVDAAQAPLWLPCHLGQLGVDMMTLDAGKCHGPKGVGVLAFRGGIDLLPIMYGGGQENNLRPGTENVAGIVGAAKAVALAQAEYQRTADAVAEVRGYGLQLILEKVPGTILNGPKKEDRLPNNINISLPGYDTEYAIVYLDKHGIAASTKSACAGAGSGESIVVKTVTGDAARAQSTIRFSLGPKTTKTDFQKVVEILLKFQKLMQG